MAKINFIIQYQCACVCARACVCVERERAKTNDCQVLFISCFQSFRHNPRETNARPQGCFLSLLPKRPPLSPTHGVWYQVFSSTDWQEALPGPEEADFRCRYCLEVVVMGKFSHATHPVWAGDYKLGLSDKERETFAVSVVLTDHRDKWFCR